jgi:cellulose synthase/poly-beta-1,6-N-acetylglucosamine synthase-like glycosyltransferase
LAQRSPTDKGFFAALFDFSLSAYVTLKFLKLLYVVVVIVVGLTTLAFFVGFLAKGGAYVVVAIIAVPIVGLVYLILARIYIELVSVIFRIAENTTIMASALRPDAAIQPAGYGPVPPFGSVDFPPPGAGYGPPPGAPSV